MINRFSSVFHLFLLHFILYFYQSEGRIIYFGNCPIVIDGECDSSLVKFYIYSRSNPKKPIYVEFNENGKDNLTDSTYNSSLINKIIIHGYNADMYLDVLQNIKDEYLSSPTDMNVWMVNYPKLVVSPCYPFSVYDINYVGKCVAGVIKRLKNITANGELDVHIIGFSLGGQVTNYIAKYLPFKVPRITGLDPALPLFNIKAINDRLDPSDADFVDIIHTNALIQGQVFPCGHVDFYANGGVIQPGCSGSDLFNCYHRRSAEYFAESIKTKDGFWGWYCSSFFDFIENKCQPKEPLRIMGEFVDSRYPGVYLIDTEANSPFAKGKNITRIIINYYSNINNKRFEGNSINKIMNSENLPFYYLPF